tara:strand:- start:316 stop:534 length:219 start_codon:yes stop_codon:yes gene_type:complete
MAKIKAGLTHSTADGQTRDNIKYVAEAISGDTVVDFELKVGGTTKLNLPTSDPVVAGELWVDSLVVKVSAGE